MGKYSDVDIDAMLKRIRENVDKQSIDAENKKDVEKKPVSDTSNDSSDELINKVMADMGRELGTQGRSANLDQYDISGFEIEAIEDEETEESPTDENEGDDEMSVEAVTEIEEQDAVFEEPTVNESVDSEETAVDEVTEDVLDENEDIEKSAEINEPDDLFEELSAEADEVIDDVDDEESDDKTVLKADDNLTVDESVENVEDSYTESEDSDFTVEVEETKGSEEDGEELVLEQLTDIVSLPPEDEGVMLISQEEIEETVETEVVEAEEMASESVPLEENISTEEENGDLKKMPRVTKSFLKSFGTRNSSDESCLGDGEDSSYGGLDYSDMNLAMALGSKDSLESAYGFVKVSEAKHNFVNTERKGSGTNVILDNKGREYRTFDQNMEIKEAYRKEKKRMGKRIIITAVIFLLITLCEMMYPTGVISDLSEHLSLQLRYNIISFILFAIAVAVSARKLIHGIIGFFTTRSNYYTVVGFVSLVNTIYSLLVLTVFADYDMLMLNSVAVFGILISIVGEYMQLVREIHTFELASDGNSKISLEKVDITPETTQKDSFVDSNEFVIENTTFVGRYFERSARTPGIYHLRHTVVTLTMLVSLFVAVTSVILTRDFADFVFVIELCSLLCVPVQIVFFGSYAFYITAKKLLKLDSAIIGETLVDEYVGSNTIYLDDVEVFGKHGVHVVNLEPFNSFNIIDVNYYYLSVFSKLSGPLKNAFGDVPENMKLSDNVELVNIFSNGIEAMVDEKNRILVGKIGFLVSKGVPMSKTHDDKYNEKGDISIMYLAVNGALCAKLYLKYSVTHHFERFAEDMSENGSCVGVRTLDPNITEEMIARLRPGNDRAIKVMRPTLNDFVPIGRRSDSGIITEKNPHMIARILAEGLKVKKVNETMNILWGVYSILGVAMVITFMLLGIFNRILPIYIIAYQMVWLVGLVIYIKNKLRNGKSR